MTDGRGVLAVAGLAFLLGVAAMAWQADRTRQNRLAEATAQVADTQRRADSLRAVLDAHQQQTFRLQDRADSLARVAGRQTEVAQQARQQARAAVARLDSVTTVADSVTALVAVVGDLALALDSTTAEAASWQAATAVAQQATARLRGEAILFDAARREDSLQIVALRRTIAHLAQPKECRVLGLPCPSRSLALATGAIVTLALLR